MKDPSPTLWPESSRVSSVQEEGLKACGCLEVQRADKEEKELRLRNNSEFFVKFRELSLEIEGRVLTI